MGNLASGLGKSKLANEGMASGFAASCRRRLEDFTNERLHY
jgi:hypothetical protein